MQRNVAKINPLNAGLNPFCHLLALLGAHHILHVSRIRVNKYIRCTYTVLKIDNGSYEYKNVVTILIVMLTYSCVMNIKCKLSCVRFYISILIFSNLYVEMVTVRFHSLPHCETNDRSQLQLSAYLSVPHSFEAFNPNSDAISLSQL